MRAFEYAAPKSLNEALSLLGESWSDAKILAGGVDLLGELKEGIIEPKRVVNLKTVPGLSYIKRDSKGLRIGALTTLTEIEENPIINKIFTALAQGARTVGSPQIRNMGTIGGNLCQRPRCWYYRSAIHPCIKKGGSICYAVEGENKYHAIMGGGPSYIVHPSDCAPPLIALNATVTIVGPSGKSRKELLENFYGLPIDGFIRHEAKIKPNEILTEITVPNPPAGTRSVYLKFAERGAFEFALVAVAAALTIQGGVIRDARIVLGGVAPKPWRSKEAEAVLKGKKLTPQLAMQAGEAAVQPAKPLKDNAYKVDLTKALVKRAVLQAAGMPIA